MRQQPERIWTMLIDRLKKYFWMAVIPALLFVMFTVFADGFGTGSIYIILSQCMIPMAIGYGMCFLMSIGLMEMSAGAQVILIAVIGSKLSLTYGIPGLFIGCMITGLVLGLVMGVAYTTLRIPSMVISLGMAMIFEVIARWIAGFTANVILEKTVSMVGKAPYNFVFIACAGVIFLLIFYKTPFGFHVKAVGNDELIAKSLGVDPDRTKFLCYCMAGFFFGIAGILQTCYAGQISVKLALGSLDMVFKPMMGVMIGLELNRIYDNLLVNVFVGQLSMAIIFNGLLALGLPSTAQEISTGFFLLAVMLFSANRERVGDAVRKAKIRRNGDRAVSKASNR